MKMHEIIHEFKQIKAVPLWLIYQHQVIITPGGMPTRLRVICFRFKTILLLHLSFWNGFFTKYDLLRSTIQSEKHYNQMCYRAGMQSLLFFNKMFEKDSKKGVIRFKMRHSKRSIFRRKPRVVTIVEYDMLSIPEEEEAFVHSNITFHTTAAFHTFAKLVVLGMLLVPVAYVLVVACLPLLLILFCAFAPIAILTELVGVLTVAIFQSFDPFFVEQMMVESQKRKKGHIL
mmetsp:Transcript_6093/g.11573  ORF Transcript_6093/g.11573 Transcript_6093/m.11573 type:complete len:230 (+) Transcript_6093:81-770(+)